MLQFHSDGWEIGPKITVTRRPNLAHGRMEKINGIIVHQTGAPTAGSSLNSYLQKGANGAHFLIDKDGAIYQTGSVFWRQWHVGNIRPRCMSQKTCTPVEVKAFAHMSVLQKSQYEKKKAVPDRYPSNDDSLGIEMVAGIVGNNANPDYEKATDAQNASLAWLVGQLEANFQVPSAEVFRHPDVSYKDPHEAESARW